MKTSILISKPLEGKLPNYFLIPGLSFTKREGRKFKENLNNLTILFKRILRKPLAERVFPTQTDSNPNSADC